MRFFGSWVSILPTRSLALADIDGQGWLSKSTCPLNTASNIPRSVSAIEAYIFRYLAVINLKMVDIYIKI